MSGSVNAVHNISASKAKREYMLTLQKAVSDYFASKQILHFGFAE